MNPAFAGFGILGVKFESRRQVVCTTSTDSKLPST